MSLDCSVIKIARKGVNNLGWTHYQMIADYNLTNFDEIVVPVYFIYTEHSLDLDDERFHGYS